MSDRLKIGLLLGILLLVGLLIYDSGVDEGVEPTLSATSEVQHGELYSIDELKSREYQSQLKIEEELSPGINYQRYIASYDSDGLKIYGLLTVPDGVEEKERLATVVFLHGLVQPNAYRSDGVYNGSQDGLARAGFVTFKPDYRGHGRSDGEAEGALFSSGYVIDSLHAISALKGYEHADPERIGVLGHSNGGAVALRVLTVSNDVKAAVIWSGTVGSYEQIMEEYAAEMPFLSRFMRPAMAEYGSLRESADFWASADPHNYLDTISTPIQLHHGAGDPMVPVELSKELQAALEGEGKQVELLEYSGAGHNFRGEDFENAMRSTNEFFSDVLD